MSREVNVHSTRKRGTHEKHDDRKRSRKRRRKRDVAKKSSRVSTSRRVLQNLADVSSRHQSKRKRNEPVLSRSEDQRILSRSSRTTQGAQLSSNRTTTRKTGQTRHRDASHPTSRSKRREGAGSPRLIVFSDNKTRNSRELRENEKRRRRRGARTDRPRLVLLSNEEERKNSKSEKTVLAAQKSYRTARGSTIVRKQTKIRFAEHVEVRYI